MRVNKMIAAATCPTMLASPVVAHDNPAASLSLRSENPAAMAGAQSEPPQPVPIPPVEAAQTGGISTALLIGGAVVGTRRHRRRRARRQTPQRPASKRLIKPRSSLFRETGEERGKASRERS